MSEELETTPVRSGRGRRRFQILILAVLGICVLWTAGWFALRHFVGGKIDGFEARAATEGAVLTCGERSIGGFPFRMDVSCMPLAAACPAEALSVDLAGIEAIGLAYNPGRALFAAKGPLTLKGPDGASVEANWKTLQSSIRIGFSGLARYSLVTDNLDATLAAPGRLPAPVPVSAGHAEFHVVPDEAAADTLDLFLSLEQFTAALPGRPSLPPLDAAIAIAAPAELVLKQGRTAERWVASGKPVTIERLDLAIGDVRAQLSGALTPAADGLLNGRLTLRLDDLAKLPGLADTLAPGSGQKVQQVLGIAGMLLRPVTIDGKAWRETTVTVTGGRAMLGFVPLGVLPRIGPPPAVLPEVAAVTPEPPASPPAAPQPEAPAASAEPPALPPTADAGSAAPAPGAAPAEELAPPLELEPLAPAGRCAVTS